ncbi:Shedu immune nuclease family protein [Pseudomonas fluorescens]|uniref:Shedu immune nuclease family protein n=1 Tax=Pseudomonas fluorescens TaxID=294 RepID=UPI0007D06C76|nr:Shedu immune nuclease family protein [Pseudomonas fluorescens]
MSIDEKLFEEVMHSLKLARDLREARTIDSETISDALAFKLSHHFDPEGDIKDHLSDLLESVDEQYENAIQRFLGVNHTVADFKKKIKHNPEFKKIIVSGKQARSSIEAVIEHIEENYIDDDTRAFASLCLNAFTDINSMLLEKDVVPLIKRGVYSEDLASAIQVWQDSANKKSKDENFWQQELSARKGILERLIGGYALFLQREFHVGITNTKGKGSKRSDFALIDKLSNNLTLIEIKTPDTKLLGSSYRDTYPLSRELSGTISQVLNQRNELIMNFYSKRHDSEKSFEVFSPKCFIIAGHTKCLDEKTDKKKAFEVQRQAVAAHVTIVTFDELYHQFSTFNQI